MLESGSVLQDTFTQTTTIEALLNADDMSTHYRNFISQFDIPL